MRRQAIERRATQQNALRTQGEGFHDVTAATNAAVQQNRKLPIKSRDDICEYVDGGRSAIKLTATMVRDDDSIHTGALRVNRIFWAHDTLDQQRAFPFLPNAANISPRKLRVPLRSGKLGQFSVARAVSDKVQEVLKSGTVRPEPYGGQPSRMQKPIENSPRANADFVGEAVPQITFALAAHE